MVPARLETARLVLEPLSDEHVELEVELDADAEVMRYITARPRGRDDVVRMHHVRLATARREPGLGVWVGSTSGEPVGWRLLRGRPRVPGEVELGYRLLSRFAGAWRPRGPRRAASSTRSIATTGRVDAFFLVGAVPTLA